MGLDDIGRPRYEVSHQIYNFNKMIKQITEKSIGHRVGLHLFWSNERRLFFQTDKKFSDNKNDNLDDYINDYLSNQGLPNGIMHIDTTIQNKIFSVIYLQNEITEQEVIKFVNALDL